MIFRWSVCNVAVLASLPLVAAVAPHSGALWQNMPLIALLNGHFDGSATVAQAKAHGNLGLGAFAGLDGEMAAIDGKIYRIQADGTVSRPDGASQLAYAEMVQFHADRTVTLPPGTAFNDIPKVLAASITSPNSTWAVRITGSFSTVETRAPRKQAEPYPAFCEALKTQANFHLKAVQGTMAGFIGPSYASALQNAGLHLHFVTTDERSGGHVLTFQTNQATAELQKVETMQIDFPHLPSFEKIPLDHLITCQ